MSERMEITSYIASLVKRINDLEIRVYTLESATEDKFRFVTSDNIVEITKQVEQRMTENLEKRWEEISKEQE